MWATSERTTSQDIIVERQSGTRQKPKRTEHQGEVGRENLKAKADRPVNSMEIPSGNVFHTIALAVFWSKWAGTGYPPLSGRGLFCPASCLFICLEVKGHERRLPVTASGHFCPSARSAGPVGGWPFGCQPTGHPETIHTQNHATTQKGPALLTGALTVWRCGLLLSRHPLGLRVAVHDVIHGLLRL